MRTYLGAAVTGLVVGLGIGGGSIIVGDNGWRDSIIFAWLLGVGTFAIAWYVLSRFDQHQDRQS